MVEIPSEQQNWLREIDPLESYNDAGVGPQSANTGNSMYLIPNSVSPQQVTEADESYLIENVPFVRPMRLSGGYVPEDSIKETANDWANRPATLNHPRNGTGEPVAADTKPETHIGEIENPSFDGEYVRGDIRINKSDIQSGDASKIQNALESGETIDVSSQYAAEQLPSGEYDGKYRENVERIIEPDSVAILPETNGVCSIEDGCGINPELVANSELTIPMRANETVAGVEFTGTATGSLDESELDSDEHDLEDHYLYGEGENKEDFSYPVVDAEMQLRKGNVDAAHQLGCRGQCPGAEEHDETLQALAAEFDEPPEWAMSANINETVLRRVGRHVVNALNLGTEQSDNEAAESAVDTTVTMSDKTAELVANHGFDSENLPAEDTECFSKIYDAVTSNESETESTDNMTEDAITFESEDEFEEYVADIVANRVAEREEQTQTETLVDEIVTNSAEWDADDKEELENTPVSVLESMAADVADTGSAMPGNGVSANAGGSEDYEDFPSPVASERVKELEESD